MSSRTFFFFQAEDGIRDVAVTGVQTCALPISRARMDGERHSLYSTREGEREVPRRGWQTVNPGAHASSVLSLGKKLVHLTSPVVWKPHAASGRSLGVSSSRCDRVNDSRRLRRRAASEPRPPLPGRLSSGLLSKYDHRPAPTGPAESWPARASAHFPDRSGNTGESSAASSPRWRKSFRRQNVPA